MKLSKLSRQACKSNSKLIRLFASSALVGGLGLCTTTLSAQEIFNLGEARGVFTQDLVAPGALTTDSRGYVYIADFSSQAGFSLSPSGELTQIVDFEHLGPGSDAIDVTTDLNDNVYFLASGSAIAPTTVVRYSNEGIVETYSGFAAEFPNNTFRMIDTDSQGNLLLADTDSRGIFLLGDMVSAKLIKSIWMGILRYCFPAQLRLLGIPE